MSQFAMILSSCVSIYMFVIVARIILTWFSGNIRVPDILSRITDPYLNWFRRFSFLRIGYIDLSPIAGLMVLTITNSILLFLAQYGRITLGITLALIIQSVMSAVSFVIFFLIIVLGLRLIAYMMNSDVFSGFWRIIDTISQQVTYRVNSIIFKGRIVNFVTGILVSAGLLLGLYFVLRIAVPILLELLVRSPV